MPILGILADPVFEILAEELCSPPRTSSRICAERLIEHLVLVVAQTDPFFNFLGSQVQKWATSP